MTESETDFGVAFDTTEETRLVLRNLDTFVEQEVAPIAAELGETLTNPRLGHEPNGRLTEEVLDGTKQWITNAPYADFVQVFARTTPQEEAGRHGGITCFIVEDDEFEVGSLNNAVGAVGRQAELRIDEVRVPDDRVLGDVDTAFYDAMGFLALGRLEIGAQAIGSAEWLLDRATEFANEREAFD